MFGSVEKREFVDPEEFADDELVSRAAFEPRACALAAKDATALAMLA